MDFQNEKAAKFTGFIVPILNLIDNGVIIRKGFGLFYGMIAVINLLLPLIVLTGGISTGVLTRSVGITIALIFVWIILTFACWLGFQVWWNRMKKIHTLLKDGDDFIALPLIADFIKTAGEYIAIIYIGGGVPLLIFVGIFSIFIKELAYILSFANMGAGLIFASIGIGILGYFIMLFAKYLSEMITAVASIANNTKK